MVFLRHFYQTQHGGDREMENVCDLLMADCDPDGNGVCLVTEVIGTALRYGMSTPETLRAPHSQWSRYSLVVPKNKQPANGFASKKKKKRAFTLTKMG